MKRKVFLTLILLVILFGVVGCGKNDPKKLDVDAAFTITCISPTEKLDVIETKNTTTYYFDKNQYATDYVVETLQKFKDKSVYNEYKKSQEETVESSSENFKYELKTNPKKLELVFDMIVRNIDIKDLSEEEKATLKAKAILKSNRSHKSTCKVEGIKENKLK